MRRFLFLSVLMMAMLVSGWLHSPYHGGNRGGRQDPKNSFFRPKGR